MKTIFIIFSLTLFSLTIRGQINTEYYANGQKKFDGKYLLDKPSGHWIYWFENGVKQGEGDFLNGQPSGIWTYYYSNGKKKESGNMSNGLQNGI